MVSLFLRSTLLVAVAIAAGGCSRTLLPNLLPPASDPDEGPGEDLGPTPGDLAMPDLGSLDLGPPPACRVGEPVEVHTDDRGLFDDTLVAVRDDGIDLATVFVPSPGAPDTRFNVRSRAARVDDLELILDRAAVLSQNIAGGDGQVAAAGESTVASARRGSLVTADRYEVPIDGYIYSGQTAVRSDASRSLAIEALPDGEGWLWAYSVTRGAVRQDVYIRLLPDMRIDGMEMELWTGTTVGTPVHSAVARDGTIRVASVPDGAGTAEIVELTPAGGRQSRFFTTGQPSDDVPAVTVDWAEDGEGRYAVVYFDAASQLRLAVLPESGDPLREETISFNMFGDVRPDATPTGLGVVVAQLTFGDLDPTGGLLQVFYLPYAEGEDLVDVVAVPVTRGMQLDRAGVGLATLDDGAVVVHFTDAGESRVDARTLALVVRCP